MPKIAKKCTRTYKPGIGDAWLVQLGFVDPHKQSPADMRKLIIEAKKDFRSLKDGDIKMKVFGDTWVPDSVGIAFFVKAETQIPDSYLQISILR